ncbi:BlaI/MecI/CopY family transcriptional regulator [Catenulispora rubra]|uniref:BlaI/MecI/CopY family transcriptional regulator n=1 Tax=Catenulispora rubra TaxID=280293 RepID=UPI001891F4A2|nr:BlaI/MecI/CopY family transcriptional regulator [Catenulispora rubra]
MAKDLDRAVGVLGPLEGRIMRAVWTGQVGDTFVVRDVGALLPELAYTTVMTTLRRLAEKGLLSAQAIPGQKAYVYQIAATPEQALSEASRRETAEVVDRYGDAALAAFAARLDELSPEQRRRLDELRSK